MQLHKTSTYQPALFNPASTAGLFLYQSGSLTVPGIAPVRLVGSDPRRVLLCMYYDLAALTGTTGYFFGGGTITNPLRAIPYPDGVTLKYADWGGILGYDVYVGTTIPGSVIHYTEVLFNVRQEGIKDNHQSGISGCNSISRHTDSGRKRWKAKGYDK